MPTIHNPQDMRAIVMHHVAGATDAQLQAMRPLKVYLANIDELIGQEVVQTIAGLPQYYAAMISQTGTEEPAVIDLFNTIDATLGWTRNDPGEYTLSPASGTPFPQIRTLILQSPAAPLAATDSSGAAWIAEDTIRVTTHSGGSVADSVIAGGLFVLVMVFQEVS